MINHFSILLKLCKKSEVNRSRFITQVQGKSRFITGSKDDEGKKLT